VKPSSGNIFFSHSGEMPQSGRGITKKSESLLVITYLTIALLIVMLPSAFSQAIDYENVFGDDWRKAEAFEKENRSLIEPLLKHNHISYPLAIAVIFPELVRYSALRDKMETTLLKTLYINLGEYYANFSIGHLQMKPSFAETIRSQAPKFMGRKSEIVFKDSSEFDDIKNFRKSIVNDLEDTMTQFSYLIAFFKICEKKYKTENMNEIEKVKFLSTAYNYGLDKSAEQIDFMMDKRFFNTKLFKTENYSYSEVSLCWYTKFNTRVLKGNAYPL
jgi:hypothetical protein